MRVRIAILILINVFGAAAVHADYMDDIRYTDLVNELGGSLPTGLGIQVAQVEAPISGNYIADPANAEFVGKTITPLSGPSGASGHATSVGRFFYGLNNSIAPGITNIDAYEANDWLGNGFLRFGGAQPPLTSNARIFNHSWVADNIDSIVLDVLQRVDYVVDTLDVIQVVGVNNDPVGGAPNRPIFSHSMNAISVGRIDGLHVTGTTNLNDPQGLYVAGRNAPDIVTRDVATSNATPVVSAAAALLLETADANPGLSNGSYLAGGNTIQHAASSEIVKAALLAGADRLGVTGYTASTANGLDSTFGAGELDIFNSYHIIAAGEQESEQVAPGSLLDVYGFDYDAAFDDSQTSTYRFNFASEISASLVWNIDIAGGTPFDDTATLPRFRLRLIEDGDGMSTVIATSLSSIDNTQNLWATGLDPDAEYILEVSRNDALGLADFGLAWVIDELILGDANGDKFVDAGDYSIWADNFGLFNGNATPSDGDWTLDGFVDQADYTIWADHFGTGPGPVSPEAAGGGGSSSSSLIAPIPEPSALVLLLMGAALSCALFRRRHRG